MLCYIILDYTILFFETLNPAPSPASTSLPGLEAIPDSAERVLKITPNASGTASRLHLSVESLSLSLVMALFAPARFLFALSRTSWKRPAVVSLPGLDVGS